MTVHRMHRFLIIVLLVCIIAISAGGSSANMTGPDNPSRNIPENERIIAPFEGPLKYPFTKKESVESGHWNKGSQDYPYFGAPRDGNTRNHAGVDLYPAKGAGTPVVAILDGKVIKVAPFYTRRNGEVTYAVLVDHKEFVANYAELKKPDLFRGVEVKRGQTIGVVSGTAQLHFELYTAGTPKWLSWRGKTMPANLKDPTEMMIRAFVTPRNSITSP